MPHTLTDAEGQALHMLALALRPDWRNNNPGNIIHQHQTEHGALTEADNFAHAARALITYATATGTQRKRTPDLYPKDGRHWMSTKATTGISDAGLPPRELWCIDHDTTESKCRDKHIRTVPPPGWKTWKDEQ